MVKGLCNILIGALASLTLSCNMSKFARNPAYDQEFNQQYDHYPIGRDGLYKNFKTFYERFGYEMVDQFNLDSLTTKPMVMRMDKEDFLEYLDQKRNSFPDDMFFIVSLDNEMIFNGVGVKQTSKLIQYIKNRFDNVDYFIIHKDPFQKKCNQIDIATAIYESVEAARENNFSSIRYHHLFPNKNISFGVNTPKFLATSQRKRFMSTEKSFEESCADYVTTSIEQLFDNPTPLVADDYFFFQTQDVVNYVAK